MTALRLGIIGCGAITTLQHLPALRGCPEIRLEAVVDTDLEHARRVGRRFRAARATADHLELLGNVEAVLLATPNSTHAAIANEFLGRGVHVLCEKPVAVSVAEFDTMLATARASGARLMGAHCLRFLPAFVALRQVVEAGWLGRVRRVTGGMGGPYESGNQRTDHRRDRRQAGGGILLDIGVHFLDLAIWIAGEAPSAVNYRATTAAGWEVETDTEVALEFPGGATAHLVSSATRVPENALTVRGERGWARVALATPQSVEVMAGGSLIQRRAGMQELSLPFRNMYTEQLRHFAGCIARGAPFLVADEQVRATLAVVDACYGATGSSA